MNKVIKIADNEIYVGTKDGSFIIVNKENVSWDVQLGDQVDIFKNGDDVILSLKKKSKQKNKKPSLNKWFKLCRRVFPITFTALFVVFLSALIVIVSVPRGWKYTYNGAHGVSSTIELKRTNNGGDANILYKVYGEEIIDKTRSFRIYGDKLYLRYNFDYNYVGNISSTEIVIYKDGVRYEYREKTMTAFKIISIVCMGIFAALDAVSVVILILIKNGKIKINQDEEIVEIESKEIKVEIEE